MTTTAPAAQHRPGAVVAAPETEGTYFGVPVTHFGEHGDMLALGHHDKRRTLAALNRHGRTFVGWFNLAEDYSARAQDWLDAISPRWAVFTVPDPDKGQDPDCTWWARLSDHPTPNSQPVMHLNLAALPTPQPATGTHTAGAAQ